MMLFIIILTSKKFKLLNVFVGVSIHPALVFILPFHFAYVQQKMYRLIAGHENVQKPTKYLVADWKPKGNK